MEELVSWHIAGLCDGTSNLGAFQDLTQATAIYRLPEPAKCRPWCPELFPFDSPGARIYVTASINNFPLGHHPATPGMAK
jgi:hypothetical protein